MQPIEPQTKQSQRNWPALCLCLLGAAYILIGIATEDDVLRRHLQIFLAMAAAAIVATVVLRIGMLQLIESACVSGLEWCDRIRCARERRECELQARRVAMLESSRLMEAR